MAGHAHFNPAAPGRDVTAFCVDPSCSIREVISCIDRSGRVSIALVVNEKRQLITTITDGDVRRGILAGIEMSAPVSAVIPIKQGLPRLVPVTAPLGTEVAELLSIMRREEVRQVPLVDDEGAVRDIVILSDLLLTDAFPMDALIMAGGAGKRLAPLTDEMPKPMLPVGGRPLLERIVSQLRSSGVNRISVSTHHKPEKIVQHFGDGRGFDVEMTYINEDEPLGTGGALGLMAPPNRPLLVINGDILTKLDFRAFLDYHHEQAAEMTVAVRRYELEVPFGVVECERTRVRVLNEKPTLVLMVNAGIYILEPSVFDLVPKGARFNMTDLIHWLLAAGRHVESFPVLEYWLDIGRRGDYERARGDVEGEGPANPGVPGEMGTAKR